MALTFSSSIRQRTILGFLLVVLPLMFALVSTMVRVDRLAVQMQDSLNNSAQAVEASRLISNQILNMERSAQQFIVLREDDLLTRYGNQRIQLAENISHLEALQLPEKLVSQVDALVAEEKTLHDQLEQWQSQVEKNPDLVKSPPDIRLVELVRPIPPAVMTMVKDSSEHMQIRIDRGQRGGVWQAVALVPLALLVAVVFSVLISRPLKQVTEAVRGLGSGDLTTPLSVKGPQDVRYLGEQLDWMRRRLAELDKQKLNFLQHVSHELKTPLTTIREGSELLRDGVVGELTVEQSEVAAILHENSLQLQSQVEGLLNFNLALSQELPAQLQPVDLVAVVKEVIEKHQLILRSRSIEVVTRLESRPLPGVREQLKTVMDNLLSNAIKYAPDRSQISIILQQHDHEVWLEIKDQGSGVGQEDQAQIFKPFYQGKQQSTGPVKGTGLGLAIVQRYVNLHHGSIDIVESDSGAHFRVKLPMNKLHGINVDDHV